jgi:hypothetical protein
VVNLSVLGVVSGARLGWMADFVTSTLHANPTHSAAVAIQTNRSHDEIVKEETKCESETESESESQDSECGPGRTGKPSNIRMQRMKVAEVLMEGARRLNVSDLTLIFDPDTCWGNRRGVHDALLVTARGHQNSSCMWLKFSYYLYYDPIFDLALHPLNLLTAEYPLAPN